MKKSTLHASVIKLPVWATLWKPFLLISKISPWFLLWCVHICTFSKNMHVSSFGQKFEGKLWLKEANNVMYYESQPQILHPFLTNKFYYCYFDSIFLLTSTTLCLTKTNYSRVHLSFEVEFCVPFWLRPSSYKIRPENLSGLVLLINLSDSFVTSVGVSDFCRIGRHKLLWVRGVFLLLFWEDRGSNVIKLNFLLDENDWLPDE